MLDFGRSVCTASYIIPLLLLLVSKGDLDMGADGAMVVMGAATAGATLPVLFFLFLRGAAIPMDLFFFFNLLPCRTRLQYLSCRNPPFALLF